MRYTSFFAVLLRYCMQISVVFKAEQKKTTKSRIFYSSILFSDQTTAWII
jgi:hypothetical protein